MPQLSRLTRLSSVFRIPLRPISTSPPITFSSLSLHPSILSAISSLSLISPTPIQALSTPSLLSRHSTLIAAETGAGKTLAYLLALLSNLKATDTSPHPLLQPPQNRPRLLVLVPTRELAEQTFRVAKGLSHVVKLRVRLAVGGTPVKRGLGGVDVLIGTPGSVGKMWRDGRLFLSRVGGVVVDEADVMMVDDTGFGEDVRRLLKGCGGEKGKGVVQNVYVAATVSKGLRMGVEKIHGKGGVKIVRGDRLHRVGEIGRVGAEFVRVDGGGQGKFEKVGEVIGKRTKGMGGVMVFCDRAERRENLSEYLRVECSVEVAVLGAGVDGRGDNWERFRQGDLKIVICSASFGRGIDHTGVDMVVMVDVPMTGAEYLHRVGRVRGRGKVVVLVGERERAVAEALFLAHVGEERVVMVEPKSAWKGYVEAGLDRITTRREVKTARRRGWAKWVDERTSRLGTARGVDAEDGWRERRGRVIRAR